MLVPLLSEGLHDLPHKQLAGSPLLFQEQQNKFTWSTLTVLCNKIIKNS